MEYLNVMLESNFDFKSASPVPAQNSQNYSNLDYLNQWFRYRALIKVSKAAKDLQKRIQKRIKLFRRSLECYFLGFIASELSPLLFDFVPKLFFLCQSSTKSSN